MTLQAQTYEAKLYTPLFYSSAEGRTVETDPILSATALMHAIGYTEFDLGKQFVMMGDEAVEPDYSHLTDLEFFTSDMEPLEVQTSERTLRSTSYSGELNITTTDRSVAKNITGNKGIPKRASISMSGWHRLRRYEGLEPGGRFQFTVWTDRDLPESLGFRMGIKRTGEFRAQKRDSPVETVTLNKFLLESVYEAIDETSTAELLENASSYRRGNDPRLHHFIQVDREWFESNLLEELVN